MTFRKKKQMSSSERTKMLSFKTMTKTINSKTTKASNYNKNSFFDKTMNHSDLLKYTKGYFHYKCCCESEKYIVNSINQGKYSYIDLSGVTQISKNECNYTKGIIRGKLNPKPREKPFNYPTPIKKLYHCCEFKQCGLCSTL